MPKSVRSAGWLRWAAEVVVVVVLCVVGPRAQGTEKGAGIAGSWQGTLDTEKSSRIVVKVSRAGDVGWQGVVYFLDSPSQHNTTTMSLEGGVVRFTIGPMDVRFEGKLSADGASMAGVWRQGSEPAHALTLARADGDAVWEILKADAAMAHNADPDWDVATVKPSRSDTGHFDQQQKGRQIFITNSTVKSMLIGGYGMHEQQLVGLPGWAGDERWDVEGVADVPGHASIKQFQSLMRKILAERFGLRAHLERRLLSVYAITVAGGGPKLEKSAGDPNAWMHEDDDDHGNSGQRTMHMTNATIGEFALLMTFMQDRPAVDQTGLTGRYDFKLTWTYDITKTPTEGNVAPTLFTAVQQQMGLKMEPVKAAADVLVIDHVERPSPN